MWLDCFSDEGQSISVKAPTPLATAEVTRPYVSVKAVWSLTNAQCLYNRLSMQDSIS